LASSNGHLDVIDLLIKHGADVNSKDCNNNTHLHFAALNGHLHVVEYFVNKGCVLDSQTIGIEH